MLGEVGEECPVLGPQVSFYKMWFCCLHQVVIFSKHWSDLQSSVKQQESHHHQIQYEVMVLCQKMLDWFFRVGWVTAPSEGIQVSHGLVHE